MKTEPGTDVYIVMVNRIGQHFAGEKALGDGVHQFIGSFSSWWDSWATNQQQEDTYTKSFHEMTWEKAILRCIEEVKKREIELYGSYSGQWDRGYNMAVKDITFALNNLLEKKE